MSRKANITVNRHSRLFGALFTVVAAFLVFGYFFSFDTVTKTGSNFYSVDSEDFIKDLYTTSYHAKYDTSLLQCGAMGYPYGEYHTYSGVQQIIAFPLQFLRVCGVENVDRAVLPLVNILTLLSVLACALLLFLIFEEMKLPSAVSLAGAVLITFLMPQLQRIGAHTTLSYVFVIPLVIFLTLKMLNTAKMRYSVFYGVAFVICGLFHPYYVVFFVATALVSHWVVFFQQDQNPLWKRVRLVVSFCLQLVVPAILYMFITKLGDTAVDRTTIPFGIYAYRGRLEGLLLPFGREYFPDEIPFIVTPQWETMVYIGIVAVIATVALLVKFFVKIFKRRYKFLSITPDNNLNILLLVSLLFIVAACLMPALFYHHSDWLNYIPFFAQLRSLGRFLWYPFVVLNIYAVCWCWRVVSERKGKVARIALGALFLALFVVEDYAYCRPFGWWDRHTCPEWTDYDNTLPQNAWVSRINPADYQAILTLPVFNKGSEHCIKPTSSQHFRTTALVSMKTSLPVISNETARGSISRAYKCVELSWFPWRRFSLLDDLPNAKPLLVVCDKDTLSMNSDERRFLRYASYLCQTDDCLLYSLAIDSVEALCRDVRRDLEEKYDRNLCGSAKVFVFEDWHDQTGNKLSISVRKSAALYECPIDTSFSEYIVVSFWMDNYTADMMGRTKIEIFSETGDNESQRFFCESVCQFAKAIKGNSGMIEIPVALPAGTKKLSIRATNDVIADDTVSFRNLLIRNYGDTICLRIAGDKYLNNMPVGEKD